ncbi:copper uptake system-associated protein [Pseudomonas sp. SL4(2022)]|uniref:copper uptake system-associated protein n=1 Tax=Pseudomonas sp. SL4(2022) TaxID=2994661 RepID=UPI00226EBA28|nr:copper uptake system-associated protein [Pseudomonas sp. SL4(2022)]WAC45264.1 copper uptake system-associated protein [Pseudomonas sp. SL4(2022)]
MSRVAKIFAVFSSLLCCSVLVSAADQQQAIEQLMKHTWEKSGSVLEVAPITVVGSHAVAGWTQGDHGGRALLKQSATGWRVVMCAGDALLDLATLQDAGVPIEQAQPLNQAVLAAEAALTPQRRSQFGLFQGLVRTDGAAAHHAEQPAH